MKRIAVILGAAALLPLHADTYQFIISGDPVAAATADSHSVASAATSLETATRSVGSSLFALPLSLRRRNVVYYSANGTSLWSRLNLEQNK